MKSLWDVTYIGECRLENRIVMAPMTRCRANERKVPLDIAVTYYKQRSSAGLIITEGTSPSPNGDGYTRVPGIYTHEQMEGWKKIVNAVHDEGGKIFLQIMHVGRIAHPLNKTVGSEIVAPSAIRAHQEIYTDQKGLQSTLIPRALSITEISSVINEYKQATENAFLCQFDGVELHSASGYLPMQFLSSNANLRTDQYGGSVANRIRFVIETLEAMSSVKGSKKVGIKIWPGNSFNDIQEADPRKIYTALLKELNRLDLAYVHSVRSPNKDIDIFKWVRDLYKGTSIINGGFNVETGRQAIASNLADLIAYGTLFIANPDLVERFKKNIKLAESDINTYYTPGQKGYIDYPYANSVSSQ